jgi:hypothetical protein
MSKTAEPVNRICRFSFCHQKEFILYMQPHALIGSGGITGASRVSILPDASMPARTATGLNQLAMPMRTVPG